MIFNIKKNRKKIKVVFIVQYIQGYDKFIDVINCMKCESLFDVKVLAFPENKNKFPKNEEFDFWKSKFGENAINSICDNEWIDLEKLSPDYIFVQRPYDMYLPEKFSVYNMSLYSKICYIPYGYVLHTNNELVLPKTFLENIYIYFAENESQKKYAEKIFGEIDNSRQRYSVDLGYPVLDKLKNYIDNDNSAFNKLNNNLKILWTPRWTTDDSISGTSFFKYKDNIIKYFKEYNNYELVFRPHPMSFNNFIEKGLMTSEEVSEYISNYDNYNMNYDVSDNYYNTFRDSNVLITDFSSIIIEYLFYNKPIIICERNEEKFNKSMHELSKCLYFANNWDEVVKLLEDIKNGIDPLKSQREKLISKLNKIYDGCVKNRIMDYIKNDYLDNF